MIILIAMTGISRLFFLRGLDGCEGMTFMVVAKSNASLLSFLRVLHDDIVSLASRLRCASDSSTALSPRVAVFHRYSCA